MQNNRTTQGLVEVNYAFELRGGKINNITAALLFNLQINYKLYNERSNSPGEVICKLATDEKAHLLVVGARGVGKIHRKFFGSVSEYCVHHAHMPVVAVPPLKNNNIV